MATPIDKLTHAAVLDENMRIPISLFGQTLYVTLGQILAAQNILTITEYSPDGLDGHWHAEYAATDNYIRISTDGGNTWGPAINLRDPEAQQTDSLYTWMKFADTTTPQTSADIYDEPRDTTTAIGWAYNKPTREESDNPADYTWVRVKGADAKEECRVQEYYAVSESGSKAPMLGWVEVPANDMPAMSKEKPYLWNKERTTYTNGEYRDTTAKVIGRMGADGTSITSVTDYYLATSKATGVKTSDAGWVTDIEAAQAEWGEAKMWLWNYEKRTWSDGHIDEVKPHRIARWAKDGEDGRGIVSVTEEYAVSGSSTTAPADASFSTSIPVMTDTMRYLWNREKTKFTDNSTVTTTPIVIGVKGQNGESGATVVSVTNYYLASASASGVTASTSGWVTDATHANATISAEKPYLWNYEVTKWSKGADTSTKPHIVGRFGKDGKDGVGITKSSTTYSTVHTESQPADSTFTLNAVPVLTPGQWLWAKAEVNYSDGKSTKTYSVSRIGANGTGVSVKSTSVTYAKSATASQPADSEFKYSSIDAAGIRLGDYLWTKCTTVYTDNKSMTSYTVSRIGSDGANGQSIQGPKGDTYYVHMAYCDSITGSLPNPSAVTGFSTTATANSAYLGTCIDRNELDPNDHTKYMWAKMRSKVRFDRTSNKLIIDDVVVSDSLKGDKGDKLNFSDLTLQDRESLKGETGQNGKTPLINPDGSITFKENPTSSELLVASKNMMSNFEKADAASEKADAATKTAGNALTTAQGKPSLDDVKKLNLSDFSKLSSQVASVSSVTDLSNTVNSNHTSLLSAVNRKASLSDVEDAGFVKIENESGMYEINLKLLRNESGSLQLQACGKASLTSPPMCFSFDMGLTEAQVNALIKAYASPLSHSHSQYLTSASLANYVTTNTAQPINALKTFTAGLQVSGRVGSSGDGEGIVIGYHSNNWAGLCLGDYAGERSVFYKNKGATPLWRYHNGSSAFDIYHPAKSGTIALTSDIPSLAGCLGYTTSMWNAETIETWVKRVCTGKGHLYSQDGWAWANSASLTVGSYSLDRQRYSAFEFRQGNLNSPWQQKAILFLPTYYDSPMMFIAQMYTSDKGGDIQTTVKRYADYDTIINGNVASATTLRDRTTNTATYLNYGAAGLTTASWLAAWNGYELRAIAPSVVGSLIGLGNYLARSGGSMTNANVVTNLNADMLDGVHNGKLKALYLNYASAPITSTANDTTSNWGRKPFINWYTTSGKLISQPSQYGFLMNISLGSGGEVHQMWFTQNTGNLYHRGGNNGGWADNGRWRTIVDSGNVVNNNPVLSRTQSTTIATIGGVAIGCRIENYVTHTELTGEVGSLTKRGILGDYALLDDLDGYLPLSGGTMTGDIILDNASFVQVNGEAGRVCIFNQSGVSVNARPDSGGSVVQFMANKSDGKTALGAACGVFLDANALKYCYYGGSWDAPKMVIMPSGDVGINTTTPTGGCFHLRKHLLVANANAYFNSSNDGSGSGAIMAWVNNALVVMAGASRSWVRDIAKFHYDGSMTVTGTCTAKSHANSSDIRLKNILGYLTLDVGIIAEAPSVRFSWKDSPGVFVGTIAQYWLAKCPEAVNTGHDGFYGVQYDALALISAISIARKVVSHDDRITTLERENTQLKTRISQLESQLKTA